MAQADAIQNLEQLEDRLSEPAPAVVQALGRLEGSAYRIADAMYAPVVWRFATYSVPLPSVAEDYTGAMHALPAMQAWREAAQAEQDAVAQYDEA